jgi:hypothetical protein
MQKINPQSALGPILYRLVYTLSRFRANSAGAPYVPTFQNLRNRWGLVQTEEIGIQEEMSDAQALVDEANDKIDEFCTRFSKAILVITKDNDRHPLYTFFFGGKNLSDFCAPKLNKQLVAMKAWVKPLQTTPHPSLAAMLPELQTLLTQADQAVKAKEAAKQHNREFRDVGARRQFVDELNAARTGAYGELAQQPFTNPGLPADFAEHFFPADPEAEEPEEDTIESVTARMAERDKDQETDRALLQKLKDEAAQAEKDAKQREEDEAALAALDTQDAEIQKQREALLAKLGKK